MTKIVLKKGIAVLMPLALVLALLLLVPAAAFAEEAGGSDFSEDNCLAGDSSLDLGDWSSSEPAPLPDSSSSFEIDSSTPPPPESETPVLVLSDPLPDSSSSFEIESSTLPPPESETPVSDLSDPLPISDDPVQPETEALPEETPDEPSEPIAESVAVEGNSYTAEITPDAVATGDNIPVEYSGLEGGDTAEFEVTFTEMGDKVIAAAQVEIPTGFTDIIFSSEWTTDGFSTSSGQQWEGRLDGVFIYLRALDEADYLTKNEWVSVTFTAKTPTVNGAYSFETRAWTQDIPDDFGTDGFGAGFTELAGTNNMAEGYKHPLVIVGTSVSTPAELAKVKPGSIFTSPVTYYYYVQTADIDLTVTDLTPIGNEIMYPFRGSYNGNGYMIENLTMNRMDEVYVGLFGAISSTANLLNIKLENVNVTGGNLGEYSNYRIGGLVGMNQGGYILNCTISGVVTNVFFSDNPGADRVGGLVGLSSGSTAYIAKCSSSATVNGYHYAGGLVGTVSNGAVVTDSYAEGTVIGADIPSGSQLGIGGLVGYVFNEWVHPEEPPYPSNQITRCYATGSVSGVSDIGGLVGNASNTIIMDSFATGMATGYPTTDEYGILSGGTRIGGLVGGIFYSSIYCSYATGNVSGLLAVGGLVGANSGGNLENCYASGNVSAIQGSVGGLVGWNGSQIINCYSTGLVNNDNPDYGDPGGLVGNNLSAATVTDSYYLDTSTTTHNGIGVPKSTSEMKNISNFDDWDIASTIAYDPYVVKVWYINEGQDYPKLFWQYNNIITVKADDASKIYGESDPTFTATYDGSILSGTLVFDREPGENVGSYAITPSGLTPPAGNEYLIHFVDGAITVTKLNIVVTADAKAKTYGDADPAFTYRASPAIGSDLANGETVSLSGPLSRIAGENVGYYIINRGAMTDEANPNYAITFNSAGLTIYSRPITVTADANTKTFGDPDPALTYQITSGSLAFSDTFSGALDRMAGEDVGVYNILQGSLALNANYNLSFLGAIFTITAKAEDPPTEGPDEDFNFDFDNEPSPVTTSPSPTQSSLLIAPESPTVSPLLSAELITLGTAEQLAELVALYEELLQYFESYKDSMTEAEYAVAVVELAVTRAAILIMEARLSGDPAVLAEAIEAYEVALEQLSNYEGYLSDEQVSIVVSLMSAIESVIASLSA